MERTAEDGTVAGPDQKAEETLILNREELSRYESAFHGVLRTRFYLSEEAAEAA